MDTHHIGYSNQSASDCRVENLCQFLNHGLERVIFLENKTQLKLNWYCNKHRPNLYKIKFPGNSEVDLLINWPIMIWCGII